jgi:integrase/recombinase XerD
MARGIGETGQAAVLDGGEIKRLIKIAGTTHHSERDQTVIILSYWLGLRAKELASLKIQDVYLPGGEIRHVLHLKGIRPVRPRFERFRPSRPTACVRRCG